MSQRRRHRGDWLGRVLDRQRERSVTVKIRLQLDYDTMPAESPQFSKPNGISDFVIRNALSAKHKDGLKAADASARQVARIQRAATKAYNAQAATLDLSLEDAKHVLKAVEDWSAPPALAHWVGDFYEALEADVAEARKAESK